MNSIPLRAYCFTILASSPSIILAWSNPHQPNCGTGISRRSIFKTIGSCASVSPLATTQVQEALAEESRPEYQNIGVLWRTFAGQAVPATPKFLAQIVHNEILGESFSSSETTGIVCVSERHDDFEHHIVQLRIIQSIKKSLKQAGRDTSKSLAIGLECFQRKDQKFLDRFIASGPEEPYNLEDLRRDSNWDVNWGYDMLHYVPILFFAQQNGIRLLGLHPSNEFVDAVSRNGLSGIPDSIIRGVSTSHTEHRERFQDATEDTMKSAFGGNEDACTAHINRLYEVQCFREECECVVIICVADPNHTCIPLRLPGSRFCGTFDITLVTFPMI